MAYTDDVFNTFGKIPTDSNFWDQSIDSFATSDGITTGFKRVIGEQVFKPIVGPLTPMYSRFVGKPISASQGWTERALSRRDVKAFNPKATAQDDLGFYDSKGIEKTFLQNIAGHVPVSIPSELVSMEQFLSRDGITRLNSMLVDSAIDAYQDAMEADIQKKVVSSIKAEKTVDITTDGIVDVIGDLMDLATEMMGDDTHYNELTDAENKQIRTRTNKVYCFMNAAYLNAYRNAKASLPSPNELTDIMEFVPMYNALPAPLTTAEFTAGRGDESLTWDTKPVAIDKKAPIAVMMASDKVEYRPVVGSYKLNMSPNGAGDFTNAHLIFKGSIAVRPWQNAIRINLKA